MKEIVYNCHVCELDEISNGEDLNFTYIKDRITGEWGNEERSRLYYYKYKKGLFSTKEASIYICVNCHLLISDYCKSQEDLYDMYGIDWYNMVELKETYLYPDPDEDGNEDERYYNLKKHYIDTNSKSGKTILNLLLNDIENFRNNLQSMKDSNEEENKIRQQEEKEEYERLDKLELKIIELLKEKNKKITVSDIDAFLKHSNLDEIKRLCEKLYDESKISFAGNGRYFVLTEGAEKKEKKTKSEKESTDPTEEVRKYAKLRDDGLITEEEYQAKKKELLGL